MRKSDIKPPLLFLHGFRGSHEGLVDIAVWLIDQGYECYYPDLPPFGRSEKDLESYDADNYAKFVADYIKDNFEDLDKHPENRPVLIGHSMGSLIAATTAAKYPDLSSDKLILLAPISEKPAKAIASLQPLSTMLPNHLVGYLSTKYLTTVKNHTALKEILKTTYACSEHYTTGKGVRASAKFSSSHKISDFDFHKDTCIIAGDSDKLVPRKHTDILAKILRERFEQGNTPYSVEINYIKGGGHLINYEHPRETAEIIIKFLESH
ncbi:MAG: alpha/beta hydrolase [Candidatus Saccharibacteria bacterium]|nr:alpha/beta hydrolase [Candidatus Saccharibacteria bacterium]